MVSLSACIETVYPDPSYVRRMERVAEVRLTAIEFWGYGNKDIDAIDKARQDLGLTVAACCPMLEKPMVQPGESRAFVDAIQRAVEVAHKLSCPVLIVTTGNELPDVPREDQHNAIVACLEAAAPVATDAGITLTVEPLNLLVDHAGYYLSTSAEGFDIIRQVASPAVKLLYDIYHQQITEGHLIPTITANIDLIGHFHSADTPGRHEFGVGEINYENVFRAIARTGWDGHIGLEYRPSCDPDEALSKCKAVFDAALAGLE